MNVMDLSSILNELDTTFLVDNNTENITEDSVAKEITEHSEGFAHTVSSKCIPKCSVQLHILDKDVSVDEEVLPVPLEPICTHIITKTACDVVFGGNELLLPEESSKNTFQNELILPSILRRESSSCTVIRKVSFPEQEDELASYKEPEHDRPWIINNYLAPESILQIYQASCKRHKTIELDTIKNFILDIKNNTDHSAILNMSQVNITNEVNETLETILKIANFRTLVLHECKFTLETISEFLNMLEYYESVCEIDVSMNFDDEMAWKCFCETCTNIMVLESISFKGMVIDENYMRMLLNAVKVNSRITTLRFDACTLIKLPSFYLVESLMTNTTLCELYLPSTGLYTKEADCLGRFLQKNFSLKVLDISNNFIGDRGLEVLSKGLTRQTTPGIGLSVLIVFNNQITEKSGPIINSIISDCKNLHTLNIGFNSLTDEVIANIVPSLQVTTSLEGLGLQSTLLTCKGIDYLASAIEHNTSLQKINLKGNKAIQVPGLERLCQALTSSKICKIKIDETNRSAHDPQAYVELVKKMNAICTVNKTFKEATSDQMLNISQVVSRKMSLSCEPRYVTPDGLCTPVHPESQVTSTPASQTARSRFHITKVQDSSSSVSRFKVTRVISSPNEELTLEKIGNVHSSICLPENDDSPQPDTDSD